MCVVGLLLIGIYVAFKVGIVYCCLSYIIIYLRRHESPVVKIPAELIQ
jgi:hypothetical protein